MLAYEYDGNVSVQLRTNGGHFVWTEIVGDMAFEIVEGGIDIQYVSGHLADVEKEIFTALVAYQARAKNISQDTAGVFKECAPADLAEVSEKEEIPVVEVEPKAPVNIPFEAPLQPHESTGQLPSADQKKDWIKKNFPKN